MKYLIENVLMVTHDTRGILTDHAVAIVDTKIHSVAPRNTFLLDDEYHRIDGGGRLLMPGLVNTHMHCYSTFSRGLALRGKPKNFYEVLKLLWWKLDSSLDLEACYYSALLPSLVAVKHGITAIIDHHASSRSVDGSLDQIEAGLSEVGLRGVLCYETSDRDGRDIAKAGLRENERYLKRCRIAKKSPDHPYEGMVGLHASFTLENDTLAAAAALGQSLGAGCHIHLAEDPVDGSMTRQKHRLGLVERLRRYGILHPRSIAAHCIHLEDHEKDLLSESEVAVAHTPQSNMNNAVGRTDIFGYLQRGMSVGLGTDGMSGDIKPDIRTAMWLHKHDLRDGNAGWNEIQQMVLNHNPALYERVSGQKVGRIAPGYLADLILVDYFPPTPINLDNFWGHFLFGIADAAVHLTMINGRVVMQNGEVPGIDEAAIAASAQRVAGNVWKKFYDE